MGCVPSYDAPSMTADSTASINSALAIKQLLKSMPQFNALELNQAKAMGEQNLGLTSQARAAGLADASSMAPGVMQTMRAYNPQQTGLLDALSHQAQEQLKLNGALDAGTQRTLQQGLRTAQSARGLGTGPGDAAMEAYYTAQTQEQRRAQNQQFASNTAGQLANTYQNPFSIMMGYSQQVPTNNNMAASMGEASGVMGTMYNAEAAASTARSNNQAAMMSSMMSNTASL